MASIFSKMFLNSDGLAKGGLRTLRVSLEADPQLVKLLDTLITHSDDPAEILSKLEKHLDGTEDLGVKLSNDSDALIRSASFKEFVGTSMFKHLVDPDALKALDTFHSDFIGLLHKTSPIAEGDVKSSIDALVNKVAQESNISRDTDAFKSLYGDAVELMTQKKADIDYIVEKRISAEGGQTLSSVDKTRIKKETYKQWSEVDVDLATVRKAESPDPLNPTKMPEDSVVSKANVLKKSPKETGTTAPKAPNAPNAKFFGGAFKSNLEESLLREIIHAENPALLTDDTVDVLIKFVAENSEKEGDNLFKAWKKAVKKDGLFDGADLSKEELKFLQNGFVKGLMGENTLNALSSYSKKLEELFNSSDDLLEKSKEFLSPEDLKKIEKGDMSLTLDPLLNQMTKGLEKEGLAWSPLNRSLRNAIHSHGEALLRYREEAIESFIEEQQFILREEASAKGKIVQGDQWGRINRELREEAHSKWTDNASKADLKNGVPDALKVVRKTDGNVKATEIKGLYKEGLAYQYTIGLIPNFIAAVRSPWRMFRNAIGRDQTCLPFNAVPTNVAAGLRYIKPRIDHFDTILKESGAAEQLLRLEGDLNVLAKRFKDGTIDSATFKNDIELTYKTYANDKAFTGALDKAHEDMLGLRENIKQIKAIDGYTWEKGLNSRQKSSFLKWMDRELSQVENFVKADPSDNIFCQEMLDQVDNILKKTPNTSNPKPEIHASLSAMIRNRLGGTRFINRTEGFNPAINEATDAFKYAADGTLVLHKDGDLPSFLVQNNDWLSIEQCAVSNTTFMKKSEDFGTVNIGYGVMTVAEAFKALMKPQSDFMKNWASGDMKNVAADLVKIVGYSPEGETLANQIVEVLMYAQGKEGRATLPSDIGDSLKNAISKAKSEGNERLTEALGNVLDHSKVVKDAGDPGGPRATYYEMYYERMRLRLINYAEKQGTTFDIKDLSLNSYKDLPKTILNLGNMAGPAVTEILDNVWNTTYRRLGFFLGAKKAIRIVDDPELYKAAGGYVPLHKSKVIWGPGESFKESNHIMKLVNPALEVGLYMPGRALNNVFAKPFYDNNLRLFDTLPFELRVRPIVRQYGIMGAVSYGAWETGAHSLSTPEEQRSNFGGSSAQTLAKGLDYAYAYPGQAIGNGMMLLAGAPFDLPNAVWDAAHLRMPDFPVSSLMRDPFNATIGAGRKLLDNSIKYKDLNAETIELLAVSDNARLKAIEESDNTNHVAKADEYVEKIQATLRDYKTLEETKAQVRAFLADDKKIKTPEKIAGFKNTLKEALAAQEALKERAEGIKTKTTGLLHGALVKNYTGEKEIKPLTEKNPITGEEEAVVNENGDALYEYGAILFAQKSNDWAAKAEAEHQEALNKLKTKKALPKDIKDQKTARKKAIAKWGLLAEKRGESAEEAREAADDANKYLKQIQEKVDLVNDPQFIALLNSNTDPESAKKDFFAKATEASTADPALMTAALGFDSSRGLNVAAPTGTGVEEAGGTKTQKPAIVAEVKGARTVIGKTDTSPLGQIKAEANEIYTRINGNVERADRLTNARTDDNTQSAAEVIQVMETYKADVEKLATELEKDDENLSKVSTLNNLVKNTITPEIAAAENLQKLIDARYGEISNIRDKAEILKTTINGFTNETDLAKAQLILDDLKGKDAAVINSKSSILHENNGNKSGLLEELSTHARLVQNSVVGSTVYKDNTSFAAKTNQNLKDIGEYGLGNQFFGTGEHGGMGRAGALGKAAFNKVAGGFDWWRDLKNSQKTQSGRNTLNMAEQGAVSFAGIIGFNIIAPLLFGGKENVPTVLRWGFVVGMIAYAFGIRSAKTGQDMVDANTGKMSFSQQMGEEDRLQHGKYLAPADEYHNYASNTATPQTTGSNNLPTGGRVFTVPIKTETGHVKGKLVSIDGTFMVQPMDGGMPEVKKGVVDTTGLQTEKEAKITIHPNMKAKVNQAIRDNVQRSIIDEGSDNLPTALHGHVQVTEHCAPTGEPPNMVEYTVGAAYIKGAHDDLTGSVCGRAS